MARIFLVEDDGRNIDIVKYCCEKLGRHEHEIIAEARDMDKALELVNQLAELKIDLVILDGNLTDGDSSGNDGETIAKLIRAKHPHIKILAWSLKKYDWGDLFVYKGIEIKDFETLLQAVNQLLEK